MKPKAIEGKGDEKAVRLRYKDLAMLRDVYFYEAGFCEGKQDERILAELDRAIAAHERKASK